MNSYLTFQLGAESFALNVKNVINILEMYKITKVPKMPKYVKGAINLRGEVLTVIDTRLKFGMEETKITKNTCILVLDVNISSNKVKIGVLVDMVNEVIELDENTIKPPATIGEKYNNEFIIGMILNNDKFTMLLDINKVFSTEEIISIENIKEPAIEV